VEGPAAVDVAINFIERWVKQAGTRNLFKLVGGIGVHHRKVDVLLPEGLQQYLVRPAAGSLNMSSRLGVGRACTAAV
jgi:hypothetical protein